MKKLFIVFDLDEFNSLKFKLNANTVLVHIGYLKVICFERDGEEYEVEVIGEDKNFWLERFRNEVSKCNYNSLHTYSNLIYANFIRPLSYAFLCLSKLISGHQISLVHLSSIVSQNYLPLVAAEGDNVKQVFWYRDIFYSSILLDGLQKSGIKVTFKDEGDFRTRLLLKIRPVIVGMAKLAIQIKQNGLCWNNKIDSELIDEDVVFVRNDIGIRKLLQLKEIGKLSSRSVAVVFRQLNKKSTKNLGCLTHPIFLKVPVKAIIFAFANVFSKKNSGSKAYITLGQGAFSTTINCKSIDRAIKWELIDKEIYLRVLREFLNDVNGIKKIHSFEMINPVACLDVVAAREKEIKIFSYQVASIDFNRIVRFPDFDLFRCSSKFDREMLVALGVPEKKLEYFNDEINSPHCLVKEKIDIKKVVYFSQPFPMPLAENVSIITLLTMLAAKYDFNLLIRPHPRDNLNYNELFPSVKVLNEIQGLDRLYEADLIVSRTSRVLFDSLIKNVPYCALLLNSYSRDVKTIYTSDEMASSIYYNIYELNKPFEDKSNFLSAFYKSRANTIRKYV